ncbi:hypothetical protein OXB_1723 [Bacillus sp. OxB-1]|uniref:DNA sulfur modification protein DndB n=1 Tax=Bacillus sp. (strain OxB-1) TaxID=98228 RepID=UPI000581D8B0|nr:DNA sulfur modification protein DndB [Bacillus sp. OxB-1]BAQ10194.1 hypothetical protein OXB_1723 [Bacillus sp. OxB-1]
MPNKGVLTKFRGTLHRQFGKQVLSTQLPFGTLEAIFGIDYDVQRQLDASRRAEIRKFILDSLEKGKPFYFAPFVFSSRKNIRVVEDGFEIEPRDKIYILDGQHRNSALSSAISHLKTMKEAAEEIGDFLESQKVQSHIDQLVNYPVSMQVFLDLDTRSEQQLFTDYNTERKEAHPGLLMQYDHRDKYIELTRNVAYQLADTLDIEHKRSRLTAQNSSVTSLTIMRRCLIALFEGLLTVKTGDPYPRCKLTEMPKVAKYFFQSWNDLFPKQMANRSTYVTGLTGIQIALAYTAFLTMRENNITYYKAIDMLRLLNRRCTWKHDDPLFTHMYHSEAKQLRHHSSTTAIKRTALEFLSVIEQERGMENDYSSRLF